MLLCERDTCYRQHEYSDGFDAVQGIVGIVVAVVTVLAGSLVGTTTIVGL